MLTTKLLIAILIDIADYFISNIPVLNIAWDCVTIIALYFLLNNKHLSLIGLTEFLVPLFKLREAPRALGAYLPTATIIVLIDIIKERRWVEEEIE